MRYVGSEALSELLPMGAAIDALEAAFASDRLADAPPRAHVDVPDGTLLVMPAAGADGVGVKLVTLNPSNPDAGLPFIHGVYVLFDPGSLVPSVIIDGAAMTGLRTAAVSGLATKHLARPDAGRLVIFGAGTQGNAHLDAMRAVRRLKHVTVVSRTVERASALVEKARAYGVDAEVADPPAVSEADLVCTCTTSDEPVFEGRHLRPGVHVNAVGAYQPTSRELDDDAVSRARVVVETRAAAMEEAGDILVPMRAGVIGEDHVVAELSDVVRGEVSVRTSGDDVTLFKSVGVAFEDLAIARAVVNRLR